MTIRALPIIILLLLILPIVVKAQGWQIKSYNIGYRIFEVSAVGNNPTTIAPLLKEPDAYQRYLNTINYNSVYGNPGFFPLHTFYVNAEWQKYNSFSSFWKKHTLQAGVLLTSRISQRAGTIGDESHLYSADTTSHRYMYSLNKIQQFAGANAGVNRQFKSFKRFQLFAGIQAQGSFAIVHHYQQRWDSSTFRPSRGWNERTTHLSNLEGKNFFQWQVMLPIGVEYMLYKERFFIRLEVVPGIIGSRYRPKLNSAREAHSAGIWLVCKPKIK